MNSRTRRAAASGDRSRDCGDGPCAGRSARQTDLRSALYQVFDNISYFLRCRQHGSCRAKIPCSAHPRVLRPWQHRSVPPSDAPRDVAARRGRRPVPGKGRKSRHRGCAERPSSGDGGVSRVSLRTRPGGAQGRGPKSAEAEGQSCGQQPPNGALKGARYRISDEAASSAPSETMLMPRRLPRVNAGACPVPCSAMAGQRCRSAVTSISISISGLIRSQTIIVAAGRISPKASPRIGKTMSANDASVR